jgi:hypothetical protein
MVNEQNMLQALGVDGISEAPNCAKIVRKYKLERSTLPRRH